MMCKLEREIDELIKVECDNYAFRVCLHLKLSQPWWRES